MGRSLISDLKKLALLSFYSALTRLSLWDKQRIQREPVFFVRSLTFKTSQLLLRLVGQQRNAFHVWRNGENDGEDGGEYTNDSARCMSSSKKPSCCAERQLRYGRAFVTEEGACPCTAQSTALQCLLVLLASLSHSLTC